MSLVAGISVPDHSSELVFFELLEEPPLDEEDSPGRADVSIGWISEELSPGVEPPPMMELRVEDVAVPQEQRSPAKERVSRALICDFFICLFFQKRPPNAMRRTRVEVFSFQGFFPYFKLRTWRASHKRQVVESFLVHFGVEWLRGLGNAWRFSGLRAKYEGAFFVRLCSLHARLGLCRLSLHEEDQTGPRHRETRGKRTHVGRNRRRFQTH